MAVLYAQRVLYNVVCDVVSIESGKAGARLNAKFCICLLFVQFYFYKEPVFIKVQPPYNIQCRE